MLENVRPKVGTVYSDSNLPLLVRDRYELQK